MSQSDDEVMNEINTAISDHLTASAELLWGELTSAPAEAELRASPEAFLGDLAMQTKKHLRHCWRAGFMRSLKRASVIGGVESYIISRRRPPFRWDWQDGNKFGISTKDYASAWDWIKEATSHGYAVSFHRTG
jgi:hypothetical protein